MGRLSPLRLVNNPGQHGKKGGGGHGHPEPKLLDLLDRNDSQDEVEEAAGRFEDNGREKEGCEPEKNEGCEEESYSDADLESVGSLADSQVENLAEKQGVQEPIWNDGDPEDSVKRGDRHVAGGEPGQVDLGQSLQNRPEEVGVD